MTVSRASSFLSTSSVSSSLSASSALRRRGPRAGVYLAGGALALLALSGCAGEPAPTPSPSASASASSEPSATPSPTPSATPTPEPAGTAVTLGCDQVLTPQDIYDYNPNYGTAAGYSPAKGSPAETAVQYKGVACAWSNQTSNEVIAVAIATPNDVLAMTLKDQAISQSNAVPTFGNPPEVEGFFTAAGGTGIGQVFTRGYWVTVSSPEFFEPGDAQGLLATVVSHLP